MDGMDNVRSKVTYMLSATTLLVLAFNIIYLLSSCDLSAISTLRVVALLVLSCLAFAIVARFMYRKLSESAGVIFSSIILVIVMGFAILDITKLQEQPSAGVIFSSIILVIVMGFAILDLVSTPSQPPQQQSQTAIPTDEQPAIKSSESFYSYSEDSLSSCEFDELEVEGQQKTENQNILQKVVDFSKFNGSLCLTEEKYKDTIRGLVGWLEKYLSSASCEESVRKNFEEITEKLVEFSGYPVIYLRDKISDKMKKTVEDIYVVANRIFKHYENKKCDGQRKPKHRKTMKAVRIVECVLRFLESYRSCDDEFIYTYTSLLSAREYRALIFAREYWALLSSKLKKLNSENFISMIKEAGKREHSELTDDKLRNEELKKFHKKVKLMENDISNAIVELERQEDIIEEHFESCRELWESVYFSIYMYRKIVSRYYAFIDIMTNRNGMHTIADLIKIQMLLYDSDRMKRSILLFWEFYVLLHNKKDVSPDAYKGWKALVVSPDAYKGWKALVGICSSVRNSIDANRNVVIDLTVFKFAGSLLDASKHIQVYNTPIYLIHKKGDLISYNFYYCATSDYDRNPWCDRIKE